MVAESSSRSIRHDDDSDDDEEDLESSNDNSRSGVGSSFGSHTDTGSRQTAGNDKVSIDECSVTKQRTKNVNRSKLLVYLSLVLAAATVGSLTYIFTKKQETYTFETTVRCRV